MSASKSSIWSKKSEKSVKWKIRLRLKLKRSERRSDEMPRSYKGLSNNMNARRSNILKKSVKKKKRKSKLLTHDCRRQRRWAKH